MKSAVGRATAYGVATLVPRAIGFALLPLYAQNMTPTDYGLLATIDVFSMYLGITINAGFSNALLRFYYDEDSERWRSTAFLTCLCAAAALGVAALVLIESGLFIGAGQALLTPKLHMFLSLATVTVFLEVINSIVWTLYRLEKRAPRALMVALGRAAIAIPLNIYLIAGLKLAVLGFLLSNLALAIIVGVVFTAPEVLKNWTRPDMTLLRTLTAFSLPYIPIGFIEAFLNSMGVISLNLVGGLASVGLFAIGTKIASIITLSYMPINTVWTPLMYERAKGADGHAFYSESTSYVLIFLATVVVGVVTLGGPLLIAMTPSQYSTASIVIIPLAVGAGIYSLRTNVRIGFTLARKTKLLPFYTAIPIAIGFPITLLLSAAWGIVGTSFGVALTMIATIAITGWRSRQYFHTTYQWGRIARLGLAVAVCVGLACYVPSDHFMERIGIVVLYFALVPALRIIHWNEIQRFVVPLLPKNFGFKRNVLTD